MDADDLKRLQDGLAEFASLDDAVLDQLAGEKAKTRKIKPPATPREFRKTGDASERTAIKSKAGAKERELMRTSDLAKIDDATRLARQAGVEVIVREVSVNAPPATPWTPRITSDDPARVPVCPFALRELLDRDRDMSVYDKRALAYEVFCGCCGRPTWDNGSTARNSKGSGPQCPECGYRRVVPNYLEAREKLREFKAQRREQGLPERSSRGKATRRGVNGSTRALTTENVQDLIDQRVTQIAEDIIRPYERGLQLEPNPEWSEMTKLEFYLNQTQIADKILDRSIGKAVQRNRMVNQDDEDLIRDDELSPEVVARMVAAIATGSNAGDDIDIIDAEVVEEEDADD